jgi:hypothetical protein
MAVERGAVQGLGETGQRLWVESVDITATGVFTVSLPNEVRHLAWEVVGGSITEDDVLVGFALPDSSGKNAVANTQDAVDVTKWAGWRKLERTTRYVYVYVKTAVAGATLRIIGSEGEATPLPPSAAQIAAAIAAIVVIPGQQAQTWAAPATVAMGAGSATIIAANPNRKAISIVNGGAVTVFLRQAAAVAVVTDFPIAPGGVWEEGPGGLVYRGEYRGITAGAAGSVTVVEST